MKTATVKKTLRRPTGRSTPLLETPVTEPRKNKVAVDHNKEREVPEETDLAEEEEEDNETMTTGFEKELKRLSPGR